MANPRMNWWHWFGPGCERKVGWPSRDAGTMVRQRNLQAKCISRRLRRSKTTPPSMYPPFSSCVSRSVAGGWPGICVAGEVGAGVRVRFLPLDKESQFFDHVKGDGNDENSEQSCAQHAANNDGAERLARDAAGAG